MNTPRVSLDDVPADATFKWRVLVGIIGVVAVASVLGNVALGALLSNYLTMRGERDRAKEDARVAAVQQLEAVELRKKSDEALKTREDEIDELKKRSAELATGLSRATAAEQRAKQQLAEGTASPTTLPTLDEQEILRRLGPFKLIASVSTAAINAGIRDGTVAEEAKSAARRAGRDSDELGNDRLLVRISGIAAGAGTGAWMVQISLLQRWRVPGTDGSFYVTVYEDGAIVESREADSAAPVLSAVADVTTRVCEAINRAQKK